MKAYRILILFAGSILILTTSACGIGGNYIPADSLAKSVGNFKLVSPANSVAIGNKLKLIPIIFQPNGQTPTNPNIEWKVSDEKLAKIDKDGTVTGIGDGNIIVTAKYNGQETTINLLVTKTDANGGKDGKGTTIASNPADLSKIKNIIIKLPTEASPVVDYNIDKLDGTLTFMAQAKDVDNMPLNEITFTWSSSNQSVATVNSTGVVTALASGTTNIIATAGDKTSNIIRVTVPNGKANVNVDFQGD